LIVLSVHYLARTSFRPTGLRRPRIPDQAVAGNLFGSVNNQACIQYASSNCAILDPLLVTMMDFVTDLTGASHLIFPAGRGAKLVSLVNSGWFLKMPERIVSNSRFDFFLREASIPARVCYDFSISSSPSSSPKSMRSSSS
jgi:hypothetical protein